MQPEELLQGLTDPQREAVTHGDGPLLVLAGPGSGKTRVITHRAAYLAQTITQPRHILAITFTNKAANEMRERLERLTAVDGGWAAGSGGGMTCSTFHSFCVRLLRTYADRAGLQRNFSIFDQSDQQSAMKEAIKRTDLSTDNFTPGKMLDVIGRAKNDMLTPDDIAGRGGGWQDKAIARVYEAYDAVLAEQNALDFDDLLVRTAAVLLDDRDLRAHLEDRYRYILVDEYQDTNLAQYAIARALAEGHQNLCVTGDPDQSIYAWRGANIRNILEFEEDFPRACVVRLEQNYRSTPQILACADAVIRRNRQRKKKRLWTENPAGPMVSVAECEDAAAEALFIAHQIRRHVESGGRFGDVAVFYRVNALSRQIETALRQATVPYQVARGVAFYNRKEIRDVLAYLKVAANPLDQVSLVRIINTPARGIGRTTVERLLAHAAATGRSALDVLRAPEDIPDASRAVRHLQAFAQLMTGLHDLARTGSVQDTIEYVVQHSGLIAAWSAGDDHDALENVDELISAAAEFDRQHEERLHEDDPASPDSGGTGRLTEWLTQVSLVSDIDAIDPETGAVTLMTLHAAKGLEFDVVFMAGVEHGLLPHQRSEIEAADIEEERRLCFVGMTRARRALAMSYAKWRDFRGVTQRTARSAFIKELPRNQVLVLKIGLEGLECAAEDDPDEAIPHPSEDYADWQHGQLVRHPEYGLGRVLSIVPSSSRTHARVQFEHAGEKTMILEFSELETVDPYEL